MTKDIADILEKLSDDIGDTMALILFGRVEAANKFALLFSYIQALMEILGVDEAHLRRTMLPHYRTMHEKTAQQWVDLAVSVGADARDLLAICEQFFEGTHKEIETRIDTLEQEKKEGSTT